MTAYSPEDFIEWTTPIDAQLTGHADSTEALEDLREFVTTERQQWLIGAFHTRIATLTAELRGESPEVATQDIDFATIPLQFVLTRDQLRELVTSGRLEEWQSMGMRSHLRAWHVMADFETKRQGFGKYSSKNNPDWLSGNGAESLFTQYLSSSQNLTHSGVPVRVLMEGVPYTWQGALDLGSVQQWSEARSARTSAGEWVYETPPGYWDDVITAKRAWDDEHNLTTYADVVEELEDGLFFAPYLPTELAASDRFITHDSVMRSLVLHGEASEANARSTFRLLTKYATEDPELAARLSNLTKYSSQVTYSQSGVVFFDKVKLPMILERIRTDYDTYSMGYRQASFVVSDYFPHLIATDEQREYEALVFGRTIKEGDVALSYQTEAEETSPWPVPLYRSNAQPRDTVVTETQAEPTAGARAAVHILLEGHNRLLERLTERDEGQLRRSEELIDQWHEAESKLIDANHALRRLEANHADLKAKLELEQKRVKRLMEIVELSLTPNELLRLQLELRLPLTDEF